MSQAPHAGAPKRPPARRARGLGTRLGLLASGRRWIAAIAVGLIGIVVLQLVHLELTHGSGAAIEQEEKLERQNTALSIEDSERSSGQHVAAAAQALGMVIVANGALHILNARGPLDAERAASSLTTPAPAPATSTSETAAAPSSEAASEGTQGATEAPPATETQPQTVPPASGGQTTETQQAPSAGAPTSTEATAGGGATAPAG